MPWPLKPIAALSLTATGCTAKDRPLWCNANRVRQEKVLKRQSSRPPSSHNSSMLASIEYPSLYIAHSISQDTLCMKTAVKKRTPHLVRAEHEAPPLARTEREGAFFEFEQALICASEAFYRFAGAALGPTGSSTI